MKVYPTGFSGFLGQHLVKQLQEKGYEVVYPTSNCKDLTDKELVNDFFWMENVKKPIDIVIHAANLVGGIEFNAKHQADIFYKNTLMNMNLIHECLAYYIKKFVAVGSICEYADDCQIPFKEENVLNGIPTDSNRSYGITKRMMYEQCLAYNTQYGFNFIHPLLINLFGPGDCYDDGRSHVIAALIKKFVKAKKENSNGVTVWGNGLASRSFLYVKDAADCIIHLMENHNDNSPINVGMDFEITIKDLAYMIKEIVGYNGKIVFDTSKPNGQMRRKLDVTKLNNTGWKPKYTFREALELTIQDYMVKYE